MGNCSCTYYSEDDKQVNLVQSVSTKPSVAPATFQVAKKLFIETEVYDDVYRYDEEYKLSMHDNKSERLMTEEVI